MRRGEWRHAVARRFERRERCRRVQRAVAQDQHAVRERRRRFGMRDHHRCGACGLRFCSQQREHFVGGLRIEVAGGFVGQQTGAGGARARARSPRAATRRRKAGAAGRRRGRPGRPPRASSSAGAGGMPFSSSGTATFCASVRCGRTWKAWNTKPSFCRRRRVAASSFRREMGVPSISTSPLSALSSPAIRLSSVDLPTPESPMIATNSPAPRAKSRPSSTMRPLP